MDKELVKPIYAELKGYLASADNNIEKKDRSLYNKNLWEKFNNCVERLGEGYERFLIKPRRREYGNQEYIDRTTYFQSLNGLIFVLHVEYFPSEESPYSSSSPSTVVNQSQQQTQTFQAQMVLEVQDNIYNKLDKYSEESKEKKFLTKIKESLSTISNTTQLMKKIFQEAKSFGLTITEIAEIFS